MSKIGTLIIFIFVLGSLGCGKGSAGVASVTTDSKTPGMMVAEGREDIIVPNIPYYSPCNRYSSKLAGANLSSTRVAFKQNGNSFNRIYLMSTTDDCNSETLTITESGTLSTTPINSPGQNVVVQELNIQNIEVRLNNGLMVALFNQENVCGAKDWELNKPRQINLDDSTPCFAKTAKVERAAFLIKNSKLFYVKSAAVKNLGDIKFDPKKDASFARE